MISDTKIIKIFCNLDDFMKEFEEVLEIHTFETSSKVESRKRKFKVSKSEVIKAVAKPDLIIQL